jgi:hypothetical protein
MPKGHKTDITDEMRGILIAMYRMGRTDEEAAVMAGIGESTLKVILKRGEIASRGTDINSPEAKLFEAVRKAKVESCVMPVETIMRAIEHGDVRAAQWWLEKKRPKEFGAIARLQLEGELGLVGYTMAPEERQQAIANLAQKVLAATTDPGEPAD